MCTVYVTETHHVSSTHYRIVFAMLTYTPHTILTLRLEGLEGLCSIPKHYVNKEERLTES